MRHALALECKLVFAPLLPAVPRGRPAASNLSIERTSSSWLRQLAAAAHVGR